MLPGAVATEGRSEPFADLADESVTIRECFDVSGFVRGITQRLADFIHGRIQSMVEIDEYVRSPQQAL